MTETMGSDARMAKRCYYEVLEVERTAGDGELKAAFRKAGNEMAPRPQPRRQEQRGRFKEINEAYEILKDPDKRAAYDRFGHAAFEHGGPGGPGGFGADFGSAFSDLFEGIFGMGGGRGALRPRARSRPALQHGDQAGRGLFGQNRAGPHPDLGDLRSLLGLRSKGGHPTQSLPHLRRTGPHPPCAGIFHAGADLPELPGPGPGDRQSLSPHAPVPGGSRASARSRSTFRPASRTAPASGWPARAKPALAAVLPAISTSFSPSRAHPFFQREGADLHCRVPISMVTAALGGEFEVPTIDGGNTRVKVPEGTQSGRRFRIQGKGMPVLRSKQTGDMYVQVLVETPQKLTKRQRELLGEFERLSSKDTQPEVGGFFGKVKEFLGRSGQA